MYHAVVAFCDMLFQYNSSVNLVASQLAIVYSSQFQYFWAAIARTAGKQWYILLYIQFGRLRVTEKLTDHTSDHTHSCSDNIEFSFNLKMDLEVYIASVLVKPLYNLATTSPTIVIYDPNYNGSIYIHNSVTFWSCTTIAPLVVSYSYLLFQFKLLNICYYSSCYNIPCMHG